MFTPALPSCACPPPPHPSHPQTTYQTAHGQLLDLTTAPPGSIDLSRYTKAAYMGIITYKTAFYTFYLPVACGLVLAGVADPAAYKLAQDICIDMGQYFQVRRGGWMGV
jgi:farnesyl diphosphate synthase